MRTLFIVGTLFAATGALAQPVNRCVAADGQVTYQPTPCAAGAQSAAVAGTNTSTTRARAPTEREQSQCLAAMRAQMKDFESARFEGEPRVLGELPIGDVKRTSGLAVSYAVNAKNGYGGYTGIKPMVCYLALDGSGVLRLREMD